MENSFTEPLRILVAEDEGAKAVSLLEFLSEVSFPVETEVVESIEGTFEFLGKEDFDVVVLGLNLADNEREDVLININGKYPDVGCVVITERCDENTGQEALSWERCDAYSLSKSIYYAVKFKRMERIRTQLLEKVRDTENELKDFSYIVSHDLRAPLRGIKTLVKWLATDYAGKFDENGTNQLNLLVAQAERMNSLIEGVLKYSRIGRIVEKKSKIDLNEVISRVIETIGPSEDIEIAIEDELPEIEGEYNRMVQIFQYLLDNAMKYMDKPQGEIRIGCVEEDGFWKFSVADNGPGIEEKHFEMIFQMFRNLSPKSRYESSGVGLTLVKKIVEFYGGRVWVESEVGEGSTFFFTLPKQRNEEVSGVELQVSIAN